MNFDLENFVPSILFGSFIFIVLMVANADMSHTFGVSTGKNDSVFVMNRTLSQAAAIESKVETKGPDSLSTYFPAIGTLYDTWKLIKASVQDLREAISIFISNLPGSSYLVTLVAIIMTVIGLAIAFIVLKALFRVGGFKQQ